MSASPQVILIIGIRTDALFIVMLSPYAAEQNLEPNKALICSHMLWTLQNAAILPANMSFGPENHQKTRSPERSLTWRRNPNGRDSSFSRCRKNGRSYAQRLA